jgi:hypothetical protein
MLARALHFVRERGLRQLPSRLWREPFSPSTVWGHRLRPIVRAPRAALARLRNNTYSFAAPDALVAFYDCEILPITYDFCWFVAAAELERRRRGLGSLRFVIVAGKTWESGPESDAYRSVVDAEQRRQRVYDILIPIAGLLPSQDGVALLASRKLASQLVDSCQGRLFPERYFPEFPGPDKPFAGLVCEAARNGETVPSLCAPPAMLHHLEEWKRRVCADRPVVTITLRNSPHLPLRNSNMEAWATVARQLNDRGYCAVIVPDTAQTLKGPLPGFESFAALPEASWNIGLRAALYELAFVNMGVSCGPMGLCWFNARCRHLTFKLNVDGEAATSVEFHKRVGIDPHDPLPFSSPFQRVFTFPDDAPTILREFDRLCLDLKLHHLQPDTQEAEIW